MSAPATVTAALTADDGARLSVHAELRRLTGRELAEVRVTPARYGGGTVWCVMALGHDRREVPLPGLARPIADLLRDAFPTARWGVALDYDVTTGVLTEHVTRLPACLRGAR